MLAFCLSILSYVWRTGSSDDPDDGARPALTPGEALVMRTVLTVLFGVGIVFFVVILRTFASYGTDESGWRRSWLNSAQFGRARRARERNHPRPAQDKERGRRVVRESAHDLPAELPVAGLGLAGVPTTGSLASMSAALLEQPVLGKDEKGSKEVYTVEVEKVKGKTSPKL